MSTWRSARPRSVHIDPRPLDASLERLARRLGAPAPDVASAVFARWEELVGPAVAAHATPRSLQDGQLKVEVDDPAWATALRLLAADLLGRLAAGPAGPDTVRELIVVVRR